MHFLGKNIRYLRKRSLQKQDDLALLVDKGQTTIGNWENGVSEPCLDDLIILSNFFGIPIDTLLKTDLALSIRQMEESAGNDPEREGTVSVYDHEGVLSVVNEKTEDPLSPILEEIKTIREEIEVIKSRLSDSSKNRSPDPPVGRSGLS